MKLRYVQDYLSISKFDEIEIEDFSVITGLNGSGKSHFLNALNNGSIRIENIDVDEVILYNYNDFNVFNFDNSQNNSNQELLQKQQFFQNRSSNFSQKINEKRNHILNSFQYQRVIQNIFIDDNLLNNIFSIQLFNWTEDDYLEYEKIREESNNQLYSFSSTKLQQLHSFFYNLQNVSDIRQFIDDLKLLFLNQTSLMVIKNLNYSIENLTFKEHEVAKLKDLVAKEPTVNYWNEDIRVNLSQNVLNFCEALRMFMPSFDFNYAPALIEHIPKVYQEIVNYFSDNIDTYSLKFFKSNDKVNLTGYLQVDNGFFNLRELAQEEKTYQLNKKNNEYNEFLNSKNGAVGFYDDKKFLEVFGESPVSILNTVLEEYDCNGYEFQQSELYVTLGTDINQQNVSISLYNKNGKYNTNLESLSSGEKTLLALAFSIYKLRKNRIIAKVFLMDELDSALHPLMSKRLVNVLYNYFHKELGINIVISTHSPSTVAFAPENSLYIMKKTGYNRLTKSSKDIALKELTFGVPSFSINYENRRQIFVESKYDVEYYESLYNIFKSKLNPEISLNFIASGDVQKDGNGQPKSNCDNVKNITKILRYAGNPFVWGIIDWDLNSKEPDCEYVKVLGWQRRYSIESYLLDPLIVAIFLLLEKIKEPSDFGFEESFKVHNILLFDKNKLQKIIDCMIDWLAVKITIDKSINIVYQTVNGMELSLPKSLIEYQGHKLEEKCIEVFPELNRIKKKGQDNILKNVIIKKVIEEYEELAPLDLVEILRHVQEI